MFSSRKLLSRRFLVVKFKSSLQQFYHGHHHDLVNRYITHVSQMTTELFRCCNHNSVLCSFMTYNWVYNKSCTGCGATDGVWSALPFRSTWFHFRFSRVRVAWPLVFCVVLCRLLFVLLSFGHCVVCPLIYGFWLPVWYLQTLLTIGHMKKYIKIIFWNHWTNWTFAELLIKLSKIKLQTILGKFLRSIKCDFLLLIE